MNKTNVQQFSLEGMDVKDAIDPTGCGNTFCGGFLVGWYKTRNLLTAALWGSVSASFSKPLTTSFRLLFELSLSFVRIFLTFQVSTFCMKNASVGLTSTHGDRKVGAICFRRHTLTPKALTTRATY